MTHKYMFCFGLIQMSLISPIFAWSESRLVEEAPVPVEGEIRAVIACSDDAQSDCMVGVVAAENGKDPEFKILDKHGRAKWTRPAKQFREAWIKSDREIIVVDRDDSGKTFTVRKFDDNGNEQSRIDIAASGRDDEEFDYNAAGKGDLFAVDVDTVIYSNGQIRQRPQTWKKSVQLPLYWYLLPDGSIVVSSGRSRSGGIAESARISIDGEIEWRYPGSLMLVNHIERRAVRAPKYLLAWGKDKKSLTLVDAESGKLYWKIAESNDPFGISVIRVSPSERYFVLSISKGRPNTEMVIIDTQLKRVAGSKKFPVGLEDVQFDLDEREIYAIRKIWSRDDFRKDVIRGKKVPAKLRAEKWGIDLKEKAAAVESSIEAASLQDEKLLVRPDRSALHIDFNSRNLRVIKRHE